MSEKTVAEARDALGDDVGRVSARRIEELIRAVLAASLPAQPKAEAGEPSGEAPEPLPSKLSVGTLWRPNEVSPWHVAVGEMTLDPNSETASPGDALYRWQEGPVTFQCPARFIDWRSTRAAQKQDGDLASRRVAEGSNLPSHGEAEPYPYRFDETSAPSTQEQPAASGPGEPMRFSRHDFSDDFEGDAHVCRRCGLRWYVGQNPGAPDGPCFAPLPEKNKKPTGGAPSDEDLTGYLTKDDDERLQALVKDVTGKDVILIRDWHLAFDSFRLGKEAGAASREAEVRELQDKYHELLFQVGNVYPGETRHETALRYLRSCEQSSDACMGSELAALEAKGGGKA